MESPIPALDNREFALVAWILLGLAASLFSKSLRTSIGSVVKTLLGWKLLLIFGSMSLYLAALVFLLSSAGLWTTDLLSETLFWFLFSGLLILFRAVTGGGQEDFFKKTVFSVLAIAAITEFVLNLRPLGLVLELLLVPGLVLLFGTLAVAETRHDHGHVRGFVQGLVSAVGLFLLGYTLAGMVTDPRDFLTYENLLEFLLPILLTAGLIPYVYAIAPAVYLWKLVQQVELEAGPTAGDSPVCEAAIPSSRARASPAGASASVECGLGRQPR